MLADARVHPRGGEEALLPACGGDGNAPDAQVTADHFAVGRDKRRGHVHHHMQVEALLLGVVAQICRTDPPRQIFTIAGGQGERHGDAATDGGKRGHATCELDPIRAGIVADGAAFRLQTRVLPALLVAFFHRLEGFGGFRARRHHELRRQRWVFCSEITVGGMMQANTILLMMVPAIAADRIEAGGRQAHRFMEDGLGCRGGMEFEAQGGFHGRHTT